MVWSVAYACDICGKGKGEANHWWMAGVAQLPDGSAAKPEREAGPFTLRRWTAAESQNEDVYHLCGQRCALQALERFMTEGTLETP